MCLTIGVPHSRPAAPTMPSEPTRSKLKAHTLAGGTLRTAIVVIAVRYPVSRTPDWHLWKIGLCRDRCSLRGLVENLSDAAPISAEHTVIYAAD